MGLFGVARESREPRTGSSGPSKLMMSSLRRDPAPHTSDHAGRNRGMFPGMIDVKEPSSSTRSESSPGLERTLRVVNRGIGQEDELIESSAP